MTPEAILILLRYLTICVTNAIGYTLQHPQTAGVTDACFKSVKDACGTRPEIPIILLDDQLFAFGQPVMETPYVSRLVQILKTAGIESIQIGNKVTCQEIAKLVSLLARITQKVDPRAIPHIKLGTIGLQKKTGNDSDIPEERGLASVEDLASYEYSKSTEVFDTVVRKNKLVMSGIREMVTRVIDIFGREIGTVMALAPLKAMHDYSFIHSTNVCILNVLQARALGIGGEVLHDIGIAGMLHDIGKMFIPREILDKEDKPTEEEWRQIKEHPVKGARYLLDAPDVPALAVIVAYEHHLRYNLSGYPRVSPTWKQHLCSQMTTLSDYFDAMRTARAYRKAMDWDEISSSLLTVSGVELHPVLVNNFLILIDTVRRHKVAV